MNEPTSSITHFIGALLAIAGLVLMVVFAVNKGTVWHVVSYTIFGSTMILLYITSAVYHIIPKSRPKEIFRRIDHSLIFVLIAGTYTPICLVPLRGGWGWSIFGIIWGLALLGVILKSLDILGPVISTIMYIVMGWLIIVAIVPLLEAFTFFAMLWLVLGGVFYTVGVGFYALDRFLPRTRWFGMHEVFHLFVMAGSFCHFWLMLAHVVNL